jgi:sterol desaturase/sphingolipid hydroxylase (fatty acid hydroxylase superfamily)
MVGLNMFTTVILSLLAGIWFGNGIPHFVRGITKESYPCALGNGPIPNLIAGWLAIVTTPFWIYWAHIGEHIEAAWCAAAVGLLLIGLFHAGPGAFGK